MKKKNTFITYSRIKKKKKAENIGLKSLIIKYEIM